MSIGTRKQNWNLDQEMKSWTYSSASKNMSWIQNDYIRECVCVNSSLKKYYKLWCEMDFSFRVSGVVDFEML